MKVRVMTIHTVDGQSYTHDMMTCSLNIEGDRLTFTFFRGEEKVEQVYLVRNIIMIERMGK